MFFMLLLIIILLISLVYMILKFSEVKGEIESRARVIFEHWRSTELEKQTNEKAEMLFEGWVQKEEKKIRVDAIQRSEAVIKGKVTEHLIPFFPEFKYNPKDARFMGSPVDLVVFDGLSEGEVRKVILIEIKTGKKASLSAREKNVRSCVEKKNVCYEVIHHET